MRCWRQNDGEELTFLVAVERVVGGVDVQDGAFPRGVVSIEERFNEEAVDRVLVEDDLLLALLGTLLRRQLQPVKGALAGKRISVIALPPTALPGRSGLLEQGRVERVNSELVVVLEVLVTQCERVDPLRDKFRDRVLDHVRIAVILEASREPKDYSGRMLLLPQQQRPGV